MECGLEVHYLLIMMMFLAAFFVFFIKVTFFSKRTLGNTKGDV